MFGFEERRWNGACSSLHITLCFLPFGPVTVSHLLFLAAWAGLATGFGYLANRAVSKADG